MSDYQTINEELLTLEKTLRSRFNPVKPDQKFVGNLRARLESSSILRKQRRVAYIYISTAGGLLLGLIIFLIGKDLLQESRGA